MSREVHDARIVQCGYEQKTVSSTVATLSSAQYQGATKAIIQTSLDIRYMLDHAAGGLTTSKGIKQTSTDPLLVIPAADFSKFGMIATGSDATVEVMYVREQA